MLSVIQERLWDRLHQKAKGSQDFKKEISLTEFQAVLKNYRIESKELWFAIAKELEDEGIIEFVDGHEHINQSTRIKILVMPKGLATFKLTAFYVLLFLAAYLIGVLTVIA